MTDLSNLYYFYLDYDSNAQQKFYFSELNICIQHNPTKCEVMIKYYHYIYITKKIL